MTHEEAYKKALEVEWKVEPCFSGESCWCRIITTKVPINYGTDNIEEVYIVSSGSINKAMAEHIVELHNSKINKEIYTEKEMIDFSIIAYQDVSELMNVTFDKISENRLNFENVFDKTFKL